MNLRSSVFCAVSALSLLATPLSAATFRLFDEGPALDLTLLGTFEAPIAGGLLTSANIVYNGITFATLAVGPSAPFYYAANNEVDGAGAGFGLVYNDDAFMFNDGFSDFTCNVGQCSFQFEDRGGGYPSNAGEWYIEHPLANYALGLYQIELAPVPLPAGLGLLVLAGLSLCSLRLAGRREA